MRLFLLLSLLVFPAVSHAQANSTAQPEGVANRGQAIASELGKSLYSALLKAVSTKGVAASIQVCKEIALPLTKQLNQEGIQVKRISDRLRNPKNAADRTDREVLTVYQALWKEPQKRPAYLVRKLDKDGKTAFRYYQPIAMRGMCLSCHGGGADVSDYVERVIAKHYPADNARGYELGELRGLIRVELSGATADWE